MHPAEIAAEFPDRPAVVIAETGETLTYRELAAGANRLAHLFRARGLGPGSSVAMYLGNHPRYVEVVWAAHISGIRITPIYATLTAGEAAFIVEDSSARIVVGEIAHAATMAELRGLVAADVDAWLMLDGPLEGWERYEDAVAGQPDTLIADACQGTYLWYSSGTTGRPKGIETAVEPAPLRDFDPRMVQRVMTIAGGGVPLTGHHTFLVPGPLYFAAPSGMSLSFMRTGATLVLLRRFDAREVLRAIERYRVTVGQFVPTHFARLLALPDDVRTAADLSSLHVVFHAGAPCPAHVKRAMIDWWGPIVSEYYSASEGLGMTWITASEWLERPGSVGRAVIGEVHILDDAGAELPGGQIGEVWFSGGRRFRYRNSPPSTPEHPAAARGWATVGDIGHTDDAGYLYLTDRKAYTIISGGVNVYPQEIENRLAEHPAVADVAVFGIPNAEFGEEVKAVVQPVDWASAGPELAAELEAFCRAALAGYKVPRSIDFERELPRQPTGKLFKRVLRERYLGPAVASGQRPTGTSRRT